MTIVNLAEAKARLSGLIDRALKGEEVVISRRNRQMARLVAVQAPNEARRLGWAAGRMDVASDFDDTPEDFAEYVPVARGRRRK
jgi:prevent-host-death family protein